MKHRNTVLRAINNKYEPERHLRETSIHQKRVSPFFPFFAPYRRWQSPFPLPCCPHPFGGQSAVPAPSPLPGAVAAGWQRAPLLPAKMTKSWLAQPPPLPACQGLGCAVPFKRCSLIINCGPGIQGADNGISQAPLRGRGRTALGTGSCSIIVRWNRSWRGELKSI